MKYVSINGHTIRSNAIHGRESSAKRGSSTSPGKKIMACGARLVLEADDVRVVR